MALNRRDFLAGLIAASAAAPLAAKGIWLPREETGLILPGDTDFEDFIESTPEFAAMADREQWATGGRLDIQWTLQRHFGGGYISERGGGEMSFGGQIHGYSMAYKTGRREELVNQSLPAAMNNIEVMITMSADRIDFGGGEIKSAIGRW